MIFAPCSLLVSFLDDEIKKLSPEYGFGLYEQEFSLDIQPGKRRRK